MVIAQCGESFIPIYDGVSRVMHAYADNLSARGHEVCVIVPHYPVEHPETFNYRIIDYSAFQFTKKWPYRAGIAPLDRHFMEEIKNVDFDLVHVHGPGTAGLLGIELAKRRHIPLIGTFHTKFYDDILAVTNSKTMAKFGSEIVAKFYDACDEIWAVSENAAQTLRSYGAKKEIKIMPNGTDHRILQKDKVPQVIERYNINTNVPVLLFTGRITFEKNLKRILQACSLLKKDGFDFRLLMVGMGPDFDGVKKLAEELDVSDKLSMLGFIDNTVTLDCLYSIADLFVFPSIFDTSGLVIREAAAMKTPSLVVKGSGAGECIIPGQNGLVTQDDEREIADCIKGFFALSEAERLAIGDNARRTIAVPWDGEIMDNVIANYQDAVERFKR